VETLAISTAVNRAGRDAAKMVAPLETVQTM